MKYIEATVMLIFFYHFSLIVNEVSAAPCIAYYNVLKSSQNILQRLLLSYSCYAMIWCPMIDDIMGNVVISQAAHIAICWYLVYDGDTLHGCSPFIFCWGELHSLCRVVEFLSWLIVAESAVSSLTGIDSSTSIPAFQNNGP